MSYLTTNHIHQLQKAGFKKRWLDDKSGWWMERNAYIKLVKPVKVNISVSDTHITIDLMERGQLTKWMYTELQSIRIKSKQQMTRNINQLLKAFRNGK